jgi:hypothetical protein
MRPWILVSMFAVFAACGDDGATEDECSALLMRPAAPEGTTCHVDSDLDGAADDICAPALVDPDGAYGCVLIVDDACEWTTCAD